MQKNWFLMKSGKTGNTGHDHGSRTVTSAPITRTRTHQSKTFLDLWLVLLVPQPIINMPWHRSRVMAKNRDRCSNLTYPTIRDSPTQTLHHQSRPCHRYPWPVGRRTSTHHRPKSHHHRPKCPFLHAFEQDFGTGWIHFGVLYCYLVNYCSGLYHGSAILFPK